MLNINVWPEFCFKTIGPWRRTPVGDDVEPLIRIHTAVRRRTRENQRSRKEHSTNLGAEV